jgi:hypothetical protein
VTESIRLLAAELDPGAGLTFWKNATGLASAIAGMLSANIKPTRNTPILATRWDDPLLVPIRTPLPW